MSTIWVGVIDHRHGTNLYAATTRAGLYADLAAFCREWWTTDGPGEPTVIVSTDEEVVSAYFAHQGEAGEEWHKTGEVSLAAES